MTRSTKAITKKLNHPVSVCPACGSVSAEWFRIARYVKREKKRLDWKHHSFVDNIAEQVAHPGLTEAQSRYLYALYLKLQDGESDEAND
jgi:hypothetical protein